MPFLKEHLSQSDVSDRLYDHNFGGKKTARFMYGLFLALRKTNTIVDQSSRLYDRSNVLVHEFSPLSYTLTQTNTTNRTMFCLIKSKGIVIYQIATGRIVAMDVVTGDVIWTYYFGTGSISNIGYDSKRNKLHVRYSTSTRTLDLDGTNMVTLTGLFLNQYGLYFAEEDVWVQSSGDLLRKISGETVSVVSSKTVSYISATPVRVIKEKYLLFKNNAGGAYSALLLDTNLNIIFNSSVGIEPSFLDVSDDLTRLVYGTPSQAIPSGQTEYRGTLQISIKAISINGIIGTVTHLLSKSMPEIIGTANGQSLFSGGAILDNNRIAFYQGSLNTNLNSYFAVADINTAEVLMTTRGIEPIFHVYCLFPTSQ